MKIFRTEWAIAKANIFFYCVFQNSFRKLRAQLKCFSSVHLLKMLFNHLLLSKFWLINLSPFCYRKGGGNHWKFLTELGFDLWGNCQLRSNWVTYLSNFSFLVYLRTNCFNEWFDVKSHVRVALTSKFAPLILRLIFPLFHNQVTRHGYFKRQNKLYTYSENRWSSLIWTELFRICRYNEIKTLPWNCFSVISLSAISNSRDFSRSIF